MQLQANKQLHGIGGDTHLGACFDAATDCDHPGSARPMEVLPRRPVPALPSSFSCTLTVGSETKSSPVRESGRERRRKRRHVSAMLHDCFGYVFNWCCATRSVPLQTNGESRVTATGGKETSDVAMCALRHGRNYVARKNG